jgi:hypothetical protein
MRICQSKNVYTALEETGDPEIEVSLVLSVLEEASSCSLKTLCLLPSLQSKSLYHSIQKGIHCQCHHTQLLKQPKMAQTKNAIPQSDHSDCFPPRVTPFVWLCCAATPAAAGALITNVTAYAWAAHAALLTLSKISFVTDLSTSTCVPQTICPSAHFGSDKALTCAALLRHRCRRDAKSSESVSPSTSIHGAGRSWRGATGSRTASSSDAVGASFIPADPLAGDAPRSMALGGAGGGRRLHREGAGAAGRRGVRRRPRSEPWGRRGVLRRPCSEP